MPKCRNVLLTPKLTPKLTWVLVHNVEYEEIFFGSDTDIDPVTGKPNQRHHGIMNAYLEALFPTTYKNRTAERSFPCIELSIENHKKASAIERNFRAKAPKLPRSPGQLGLPKVDWTKVSTSEVLDVARKAYIAAGVPSEIIEVNLNSQMGWLRENLLKYGCPGMKKK